MLSFQSTDDSSHFVNRILTFLFSMFGYIGSVREDTVNNANKSFINPFCDSLILILYYKQLPI